MQIKSYPLASLTTNLSSCSLPQKEMQSSNYLSKVPHTWKAVSTIKFPAWSSYMDIQETTPHSTHTCHSPFQSPSVVEI